MKTLKFVSQIKNNDQSVQSQYRLYRKEVLWLSKKANFVRNLLKMLKREE